MKTKAGRDLLAWRGHHSDWTEARWVAAIEAIETEVAIDSDDFRDRHERAMREHIIGGPTDHDCDDLCSAAIIDRLVGKTPINEYPLYSLGRSGSGGGRG